VFPARLASERTMSTAAAAADPSKPDPDAEPRAPQELSESDAPQAEPVDPARVPRELPRRACPVQFPWESLPEL
jgi:hypothetical protein